LLNISFRSLPFSWHLRFPSSVAMRLRYGGIFIDQFTARLLLSPLVTILKIDQYLTKLWERVGCPFLTHRYTVSAYRSVYARLCYGHAFCLWLRLVACQRALMCYVIVTLMTLAVEWPSNWSRTVTTAVLCHAKGARSRTMHRKRWLDNVEEDGDQVQLSLRDACRLAENRSCWMTDCNSKLRMELPQDPRTNRQ